MFVEGVLIKPNDAGIRNRLERSITKRRNIYVECGKWEDLQNYI